MLGNGKVMAWCASWLTIVSFSTRKNWTDEKLWGWWKWYFRGRPSFTIFSWFRKLASPCYWPAAKGPVFSPSEAPFEVYNIYTLTLPKDRSGLHGMLCWCSDIVHDAVSRACKEQHRQIEVKNFLSACDLNSFVIVHFFVTRLSINWNNYVSSCMKPNCGNNSAFD